MTDLVKREPFPAVVFFVIAFGILLATFSTAERQFAREDMTNQERLASPSRCLTPRPT